MKLATITLISALTAGSVQASLPCNPADPDQAIHLLALVMYHEARGEGADGMQMVGEVVLNRVESSNFPDSVCEVLYEKDQFYSVHMFHNAIEEEDKWAEAQQMAEDLMFSDISYFNNGATFFLTKKELQNAGSWVNNLTQVGMIGNHVFLSDGSDTYAMYEPNDGEEVFNE